MPKPTWRQMQVKPAEGTGTVSWRRQVVNVTRSSRASALPSEFSSGHSVALHTSSSFMDTSTWSRPGSSMQGAPQSACMRKSTPCKEQRQIA
eukprot:5923762-Amphidinium_carterae.2